MRREKIQSAAGDRIISCNLFGDLVSVSAIGPGLVIRQHGSGRFELVINLGDRDQEPLTRQQCGRAPDRCRHLENLGEQQHARITARRRWPKNVRIVPAGV